MRRIAERSFRSIHAAVLLLGCVCALDARAGARGGSFGAGITIVRSAAAVAHDGQVDGNNRDINGTLSVTPAYAGQTFTFSILTLPANGTVTLVDPAAGSFSYTADKKFRKGVDSFTFRVMDNHGVTSNIATEYVLLRVQAETHEAEVTTSPNTPVTGTLTAVSSYNGETLTFTILKDPDVGVFTLTDPQTGAFTYTPPNGFTGRVFVKFRVMDETGNFSNISIERVTVTPMPATAIGGSVTTRPNTAVSGTLSATTAFAGQVLAYRLVTQAKHGKAVITDLATGAFKYTPAKGFTGHDSFTFRVTDQAGTPSNIAVESITVHK